MASSKDIAAIGRYLSNSVESAGAGDGAFAGVIGDAPSRYSKSPQLWTAAFHRLGMHAVYLPLDVADARVGELLSALRKSDGFLGANVTVPHKVRVMEFLDAVDAGARRIQAVNTIVKTPDGKLCGYNTDGEGFIDSLLNRQPDRAESFMPSLQDARVLLLGAGGSARAVAWHVADRQNGGKLLVCNRTMGSATRLAGDIQSSGHEAQAIPEAELSVWAPRVDLVINSTTKGQGGVRRLPGGAATLLEPYSALAHAHPPSISTAEIDAPEFERRWLEAAAEDIQANHQASMILAQSIPAPTRFYDLIYHPEETVFLRHAKRTGHPTMNGKAMIIHQAAIAFCQHICKADLRARGLDAPEIYNEVVQVMYAAW
jgi:shikimate dehydrogenase